MHFPLRSGLSFLLVWLFNAGLNAQNTDGWVFKNEKDGIKVYYKKTSDVHEVKMVTSIKATLTGMAKLLNEVEHYTEWGYKVSEANLVKRVNEKEFYYYCKLDFPWPLNDRDLVLQTKVEQDSVSRRITSSSWARPDLQPEKTDVVRIKTARTRWSVLPGAGGWLYVEYYIYSDPGGNLPDWLVNMAIDMGPRETINTMRTMLQKPEYRTAKLAYIRE